MSSDASLSELKAGYGRAVEAAKGSSPGPLLPVKLAELASAFRLLVAVDPEVGASAAGPAATPAPAPASASASGLTFDLGPDAGNEPSDKQKQTDLRAGRALAAAKAYVMAKGGGGGGGSAGGVTNHSSAPEQLPEWVVLGKDVDDGWQRALDALNRAAVEAATAAAATSNPDAANKAVEEAMATAEAVFRKQAELVNADVDHYNLLVPILRMQRAPKMDRLLDIKVKAARAKALSN